MSALAAAGIPPPRAGRRRFPPEETLPMIATVLRVSLPVLVILAVGATSLFAAEPPPGEFRIDVEVTPAGPEHAGCPVYFHLPLRQVAEVLGMKDVDPDAVRVAVLDADRRTPRREIPAVYCHWVDGQHVERVAWTMPEDTSGHFAVYLSERGGRPRRPVVVGAGERLRYDPDTLAYVCPTWGNRIHSMLFGDFDGDGDHDILTRKGAERHDLFNENIGTDREPLFLPERRVAKGSMCNWDREGARAAYADLDGDGRTDRITQTMVWNDYLKQVYARTREWYRWEGPWGSRHWTGDPYEGYVWFHKNVGSNDEPEYRPAVKLMAHDGRELLEESFEYGPTGHCWPAAGDLDRDGDGDIIVPGWLNGFEYVENIGTATEPKWLHRRLPVEGEPFEWQEVKGAGRVLDFDGDGDLDLVTASKNGFVYWFENRSEPGKLWLKRPVRFMQRGGLIHGGAHVIPAAGDWDGDGDQDIILGNEQGYFLLVENVGTPTGPRFAGGRELRNERGELILFNAYPNYSEIGPNENWNGYANPDIVDWDGDGDADLLLNDIRGHVKILLNVGTRTEPVLSAEPLRLEEEGTPLHCCWRVRPAGVDFDGDGDVDLLSMRYPDGACCVWERAGRDDPVALNKAVPLKDEKGRPITTNPNPWAHSGRHNYDVCDFDGDGDLDVIVGKSPAAVELYRNVGGGAEPVFRVERLSARGRPFVAEGGGHHPGLEACDLDGDGKLDLITTLDAGHVHYYRNSYFHGPPPPRARAVRYWKIEDGRPVELPLAPLGGADPKRVEEILASGLENVARGKPASGDTFARADCDYRPEYATDGRKESPMNPQGPVRYRWIWMAPTPERGELTVDLEAPHRLELVRIWPRTDNIEVGVPRDFSILVSADGERWRSVRSVAGNMVQGRPTDVVLRGKDAPAVVGRYVRLSVTRVFTRGCPCVAELEVFGQTADK